MNITATICLIASLIGCNDTQPMNAKEYWSSFIPLHYDPITGITARKDGEPSNPLYFHEIREVYATVQDWMGLQVDSAPRVIFTDTDSITLNEKDNYTGVIYFYPDGTNVIVVRANRFRMAVKETLCHEFVHHVYSKGLGHHGASPYNSLHRGPFYDKCKSKYKIDIE